MCLYCDIAHYTGKWFSIIIEIWLKKICAINKKCKEQKGTLTFTEHHWGEWNALD